MKKILGLDLGTNSIGWAFIENDPVNHKGKILGMGSRIIPMGGMEKDFEAGTSVSKNADRRDARSIRRGLHRYKLRRKRLIQVLKTLTWIPHEFPEDFKGLTKFDINNFIPFDETTIEGAKRHYRQDAVSVDWIIYFLRTKSLREKITLAELGRILYHLNQRRGFKSGRKSKDTLKTENEQEEPKFPIFEKRNEIVKVLSITETAEKLRGNTIFNAIVELADGTELAGRIIRKKQPEWTGKELELELKKTTKKSGDVTFDFSLPEKKDWEQRKLAIEKDLNKSGLHPGEYHFRHLVEDRNYRIKDMIIDRSYYQKELDAIWAKQSEFHPILKESITNPAIALLLYPHNIQKQVEIKSNDLLYLFKKDIIYYQRPLKSQKHLIANCRYETKTGADGEKYGVKVAPISSPLFQEFRIWQDIHNLRIYSNLERASSGKISIDIDITDEVLDENGKVKLFELFQVSDTIDAKKIFKHLNTDNCPLSEKTHRLNFPVEKKFKGNVTISEILKIIRKTKAGLPENSNEYQKLCSVENNVSTDKEFLNALWHLLYSIEDPEDLTRTMTRKYDFPKILAASFAEMPAFKNDYAAFSTKAIKKLLAVMKTGKYWSAKEAEKAVNAGVIAQLQKGQEGGETDIATRLRKWQAEKGPLTSIENAQGLPVWLACYLVYGRHSERTNEEKYESYNEIKSLQANSLRNPIVEQITNETLRVVADIWKTYGRPDEIHIELARDLKKNADERKKITAANEENSKLRQKIIAFIKELRTGNPNSPMDVERIRLWEQTCPFSAKKEMPKLSAEPTPQEIEKYKQWGNQNCISPYTGKIIKVSDLFTPYYQIEHIIPKSRFFDDSFANKTICEAGVNSIKDNLTAMEFIEKYGGKEIEKEGRKFRILSVEEYQQHIKATFSGKKRRNFLTAEIPDDFVERQINDTRYIGKKLGELLFPVAADDVIFTIGAITSELKEKWGLHRVWKEILRPRFERLERITGEPLIDLNTETNDIHFRKDYKRIDHRHHALDALIAACTTRSHIKYLNTLNAQTQKRENAEVYYYLIRSKTREFVPPWENFTKEAKDNLLGIIVSHKKNTRVLTKGFNRYMRWVERDGKWVKEFTVQSSEKLFSVRRSLFKEPFGTVNLAEYHEESVNKAVEIQFEYLTNYKSKSQKRIADKQTRNQVNQLIKNCQFGLEEVKKYLKLNPLQGVPGGKIDILQFKPYAAKRVALDDSFTSDKIDKIPYADQKNNKLVVCLKEHLAAYKNKPKDAFTGEGLEALAKKYGKPINKVTISEEIGNKTPLGDKFFEEDKGSKLFFVIYENRKDSADRIINEDSTVSLMDSIYRTANKLPIAEEREGYKTIVLSPNDLVYCPDSDENLLLLDLKDKRKLCGKIYKVVSFTKGACFFVPHFVASPLIDTKELGSNNKAERDWDRVMIKQTCIPLEVDRLGNIQLKA
jgi:CRISPR-associated endonuclease Csn1